MRSIRLLSKSNRLFLYNLHCKATGCFLKATARDLHKEPGCFLVASNSVAWVLSGGMQVKEEPGSRYHEIQPAFNARLIDEVKEHPCLYNHAKRGNGDTTERMRIWETIAANVGAGCTAEFAKKRWLQLRDRYRKELKMAIRQNFVMPIRWRYFEHLSWLDPYLKDNLPVAGCDLEMAESAPSGLELSDLSANYKQECEAGTEDSLNGEYMSMLEQLLAAASQNQAVQTVSSTDSTSLEPVCDTVATASPIPNVRPEQPDEVVPVDVLGSLSVPEADNENKIVDMPQTSTQPVVSVFTSTPATSKVLPLAGRSLNSLQREGAKMQKIVYNQVEKLALDWINDEDMLYSRIIGLKLKNMEPKRRKRIRAQIMAILDDSDDDDDTVSSAKCSRHDLSLETEQIGRESPLDSGHEGSS